MFEYIAGAAALYFASRILYRANTPKIKGFLGEARVRSILSSFRGDNYAKAHDILIKGGRDTTQLDHLLISRHGIFVIETKNYSGTIQGGASSSHWTQIYRSGRKRTFLNPIIQNQIHVKAVADLLHKYPNVPIHSIVVFSNDCKYPPLPDLVKMSALKKAIEFRCSGKEVLTAREVEDIKDIIDAATIKSRRARTAHNARAHLAAQAAQNVTPEFMEELQHRARTSPRMDFGQKREPLKHSPQFVKLTDAGAIVNIRGNRGSIESLFESCKRDANGDPVPKGAPFDHFICPYTGDAFPPSEAKNLYQGLWIAYLKRNPDLVDYIREHSSERLGGSFRCEKVLKSYAANPDAFISEARNTDWYRNVAAKRPQRQPHEYRPYENKRKPLDQQISHAEQKKSPPSQENNKDQTITR